MAMEKYPVVLVLHEGKVAAITGLRIYGRLFALMKICGRIHGWLGREEV